MTEKTRQVELDGLRLIALGRVPLCSRCPRYANLVEHYVDPRSAVTRLARVPAECAHCYCTPLVRRYNASPRQLAFVEARAAS